MRIAVSVGLAFVALMLGGAPPACAQGAKSAVAATPAATATPEWPEWLFPIHPPSLLKPPPVPVKRDDVELLSIPDSKEKFTAARINDVHDAPDWYPAEHGPMPDIVAKGKRPKTIACAFCHTPTGQGRPENSALAGLTENYIRQQLKDFRSGARKPAGPLAFGPTHTMAALSKTLTDAEIDESAKYYAAQKLARRVWVVDSLRIPRAEPEAWLYKEVGGTEDLGERLLEVTTEIERHERRDPKLQYTAYVPPGSPNRGKRLVTTGDGGKTVACATCHGANLKGMGDVPPIAGRSPTYQLRQLLEFKRGDRATEGAKQMEPVVQKLELADMIDVVAYLGTLYP
jgi:cytochrome c553